MFEVLKFTSRKRLFSPSTFITLIIFAVLVILKLFNIVEASWAMAVLLPFAFDFLYSITMILDMLYIDKKFNITVTHYEKSKEGDTENV